MELVEREKKKSFNDAFAFDFRSNVFDRGPRGRVSARGRGLRPPRHRHLRIILEPIFAAHHQK